MVNEQNNEANAQLDQVEKNSEPAQSAVEASSIDANELSTQITQLTEQLQQAQEKVTQAQQQERDTALRAKAEIENIRRRAEQDIEKAHKFALEKFSNTLLPVIDNLERALQAAQEQQQNSPVTIEGIELTLKSLLDAVSKFGIESVEQLHVPFNPELHQAMAMHESDQVAPNHVLMVMQKGYTLNGRLLRPAMVAVSKAKS